MIGNLVRIAGPKFALLQRQGDVQSLIRRDEVIEIHGILADLDLDPITSPLNLCHSVHHLSIKQ